MRYWDKPRPVQSFILGLLLSQVLMYLLGQWSIFNLIFGRLVWLDEFYGWWANIRYFVETTVQGLLG